MLGGVGWPAMILALICMDTIILLIIHFYVFLCIGLSFDSSTLKHISVSIEYLEVNDKKTSWNTIIYYNKKQHCFRTFA